MKRVCFLFDRLCAKFKYRPELWESYLRLCIQIGSKKNFYRSFSNALRFNPSNLRLWSIGAYFEMELNGNPLRARQLLFKTLKGNPKDPAVWLEYFRFECRFIKQVERARKQGEDLTGGGSDPEKPADNEFDAGDDYIGFEGLDDGSRCEKLTLEDKFRDLLESSEEEEAGPGENELRLEEAKKKLDHKLLLVLLESMKESFPDGLGVETYRKLLEILRQESQKDSEELGIALRSIFDEVLKDEDLSSQDKAILYLEKKSLLTKFEDSLHDTSESYRETLMRVLSSDKYSTEDLLRGLTKAHSSILDFINKDRACLKAIQSAVSKSASVPLLTLMLSRFDIPVDESTKTLIDPHRYDEKIFKIYLTKVLADASNYQKVKYIEEFAKNIDSKGLGANSISVSALEKIEITKRLLSCVVDYLAEKKFALEETQADAYKFVGQYIKSLVSLTKLNIELMEYLGSDLIKKWIGPQKADKELVAAFGDVFWPLRKQCPPSVFAFLLQNSTKVGEF